MLPQKLCSLTCSFGFSLSKTFFQSDDRRRIKSQIFIKAYLLGEQTLRNPLSCGRILGNHTMPAGQRPQNSNNQSSRIMAPAAWVYNQVVRMVRPARIIFCCLTALVPMNKRIFRGCMS
jgi:hypothetical protein